VDGGVGGVGGVGVVGGGGGVLGGGGGSGKPFVLSYTDKGGPHRDSIWRKGEA